VQRRGGELYVLTAAGTQGRRKIPTRGTRFQRLARDVEQLQQQGDGLCMALEEAMARAMLAATTAGNAGSHAAPASTAEGGPGNSGAVVRTGAGVAAVGAVLSIEDFLQQVEEEDHAAGQREQMQLHVHRQVAERAKQQDIRAQAQRASELVRERERQAIPAGAGAEATAGAEAETGAVSLLGTVVVVVEEGWGGDLKTAIAPTTASPEPSGPGSTARPSSGRQQGPSMGKRHGQEGCRTKQQLLSAVMGAFQATADQATADGSLPWSIPPPLPTPAQVVIIPQKMMGEIHTLRQAARDVELRHSFLHYQMAHFALISQPATGSLTDLTKMRRLHALQEGEALAEDQIAAMQWEDRCAGRIQRQIRRKFGRALRLALFAKMNRCATKIQGLWRRCQVHMFSLQRGKALALALILQRLYRGKRIAKEIGLLKRDAFMRVGARHLQRVWRGWLGRRRLTLKREFMHCLVQAAKNVSIKELNPGDVEEMADNLDLFVRDYTRDLPPAVLSILRAVFYLLNGDASECVVVNNDGYIEKQYIRAQTATWMGAKLVLRRKARFLRRCRMRVGKSCPPNPSPLHFSPDCLTQMRAVAEDLELSELEEVEIGELYRKGRRIGIRETVFA
jgi:hypothetical protein